MMQSTFNLDTWYVATIMRTNRVPYGGTYPSRFKFFTWQGCSHFPRYITGFNGAMLSVVGDVPVDSEAPVVTS